MVEGDPGWSCAWPAPAKLNLFLHITGQRDDGYHSLQTLFQFLDWGDALAFRPRRDGRIERGGGSAGVPPDQDLAVQAAERLRERAALETGVDIHINQRIPCGSGLGGGSSDAATTLVALNRLWGAGLSISQLTALALELGADVPVFVHGRAVWAEGIGELLFPAAPEQPWYLVIVPPVAVATAELFAAPELTRDCAPMTMPDFLSGGASNVFEGPVRERHAPVAAALDWLADQGVQGHLSGTGACVFGAFDSEVGARTAATALPADWRGFVAPGTNRSPLATRIEALSSAAAGF